MKASDQMYSRCIIPGSLGVWEHYFEQLVGVWDSMPQSINPRHMIFAADNGIVMAGHIGYSGDITRKMTAVMVQGGSAATRFAAFNHIPVDVVDVGVNSEAPVGIDGKANRGTANFLEQLAMTEDEYSTVWHKVEKLVKARIDEGINLLSFGEMGIGNTTTSATVLSALTGESPDATVGPGSGADDEAMAKKRHIVQQGLDTYKDRLDTAPHILQAVGGFDLVALTAAMVTAYEAHIPFVIDGYITSVALACAKNMRPNITDNVILSHVSREPGMAIALQYCGMQPESAVLNTHMALGEGTGSVLMTQLLRTTYDAFMTMTAFEDMMRL